jgi:outer membrane receptor protein involved in Fe transport
MIPTRKHFGALLLGLALSLGVTNNMFTPNAVAQTSLGTLTGTVRDASGAVIADAHIMATNVATGEIREAVSSALGAYRLDALTPGNYTMRVQAPSFAAYEVKNIEVQPSQAVSFDAILNPGQVEVTVAVSADQVLLNQENASLSSTINTEEMEKLPIFSLNPVEVLTTVPGVQVVSNSGFSNGSNIQVSGARPRSNNFMIDGQEINDASIGGQAIQPNIPDMYSDTVIYTHNAPAEFGRASGGVVNLITKGGTNTFHGTAWELYSGSGLNSLDGQTRQFAAGERSAKARYDQHQYGFTLGGPALKNKLFGFGAMQLTRFYGNATFQPNWLPDANGIALLQAIGASNTTGAANAQLMLQYLNNAAYLKTFSQSGTKFRSLGTACPADTITACATGSHPGNIELGYFLRPPSPSLSPDTQWTYRVDFTPNKSDAFYGRYLHDRGSLTPDNFNYPTALPGFDTMQGGPSELGQGAWTHIFSPAILNEFRVAETRISFLFGPTAETLKNPLYASAQVSTTDMATLGFPHASFPQGRAQDMYQFQDTVSITKGRHTIRAGADIGRRIEMDLNGINQQGTLTFTNGGTGGTPIGNFLLNQLGPAGSATRTFGSPRVDPHSWRSGIFAQDDVKVFPDLTVNLGIRWDFFTNPDNSLPFPAIDPSSPTTLYGPIETKYTIPDNRHSFAPRIGFAYSPHNGTWWGDGKTVVRAGFGIFFDSEFTNITVNNAASAPNVAQGTLTASKTQYPNGLPNATGLIPQISKTVNEQSSVTSVVNNMTSPYSPEWNLTIERELPGKIGISATYAGARGVKLYANQQYNYFDINTGERLNPSRGAIVARGNFADSIYNGLEVGLRRAFSHGLMVTGSYVYSKTLDDGSEVFASGNTPTSYSANLAPGMRKLDWGNSVYDHRQYAAFTYVYSPEGFRASNKGADVLLSAFTRNWTLSGASRFQSGSFSTVNFSGLDINGDGNSANDRPVLGNKHAAMDTVGIDGMWVCGDPNCNTGGSSGTYYDLAANNTDYSLTPVDAKNVRWLIPAYGTSFMNKEIGRNSFLNPGSLYNDVALEKGFPTTFLHFERGRFLIRAEAQNLANHNNTGQLYINLLYVGGTDFMNQANARETNNRNVRFWAKFQF